MASILTRRRREVAAKRFVLGEAADYHQRQDVPSIPLTQRVFLLKHFDRSRTWRWLGWLNAVLLIVLSIGVVGC